MSVSLALVCVQMQAFGQSNSQLELEIILSDTTRIELGGRYASATLIRRNSLTIAKPSVAGSFTALYVKTVPEGSAIRVSFSMIYSDIDDQEWTRNRTEKSAGSYLIPEGETTLASGLAEFGIEPFEMKVINTAPVVLKPGEGPHIVNNTTALKVERRERHLNSYLIKLKNISNKDIIVYRIVSGNSDITSSSIGMTEPAIAAGASDEKFLIGLGLSTSNVEQLAVTISMVIFSDGTFEGDAKVAIKFLAKSEGVKAQAPYVLRMIEQTQKIDDSDIRFAFEQLEADLWVIPEALFKPEALQFLKVRFPNEDDKTLLALYEDFKGGLYDARNIALSSTGPTLRAVKGLIERGQYADATDSIRHCLNSVRQTLIKINSTGR